MSTKLLPSRPRGVVATTRGARINFSIDALTHARIVHAQYLLSKVCDVPANMSTVLRVAVAHLSEKYDAILANIERNAELPTREQRLLQKERMAALRANRGGLAPAASVVERELKLQNVPAPLMEVLKRIHVENGLTVKLPHPKSFASKVFL